MTAFTFLIKVWYDQLMYEKNLFQNPDLYMTKTLVMSKTSGNEIMLIKIMLT